MEGIIVDKVAPNEVTLTFGCAQMSFSLVRGELRMTSKANLLGGRNQVYLPKNIWIMVTKKAAAILREQQKQYQWFVEPLDAATNEAIYSGLRALNSSAADEMRRIIDADGCDHKTWEINYNFVSFLEKSAQTRTLRFQIFNRPGENAKARPWPFPRRKKTASRKAAA